MKIVTDEDYRRVAKEIGIDPERVVVTNPGQDEIVITIARVTQVEADRYGEAVEKLWYDQLGELYKSKWSIRIRSQG